MVMQGYAAGVTYTLWGDQVSIKASQGVREKAFVLEVSEAFDDHLVGTHSIFDKNWFYALMGQLSLSRVILTKTALQKHTRSLSPRI